MQWSSGKKKKSMICFALGYFIIIKSPVHFTVSASFLESLLLNSINIGPPKNRSILTIHLFNGLWNECHRQGMKIRKRRETNSSTFDPNGNLPAIRKKCDIMHKVMKRENVIKRLYRLRWLCCGSVWQKCLSVGHKHFVQRGPLVVMETTRFPS